MIRPSSTTPPLPFDESMLRAPRKNGLALLNSGNYAGALRCFEHAAAQGKAWAQYLCGCIYLHDGEYYVCPGPWDEAKAQDYLEQAARQGHRNAQFLLGRLWQRRFWQLELNGGDSAPAREQALAWYRAAERKKPADGRQKGVDELLLDWCRRATTPEKQQAFTAWLRQNYLPQPRRSAALLNKLGQRIQQEWNDPALALELYLIAAEASPQPAPGALLRCGQLYEKGIPGQLDPDPARAAGYYRQLTALPAACREKAIAAYHLACLYDQGRGVPQDLTQAMEWYRYADAQDGDALFTAADCLRVSEHYDSGAGLPGGPDPEQGFRWLECALSKLGRAPDDRRGTLQFRLAQRHQAGNGTTADPEQALRLYEGALRNGCADAEEPLRQLAQAMLDEAKALLAAGKEDDALCKLSVLAGSSALQGEADFLLGQHTSPLPLPPLPKLPEDLLSEPNAKSLCSVIRRLAEALRHYHQAAQAGWPAAAALLEQHQSEAARLCREVLQRILKKYYSYGYRLINSYVVVRRRFSWEHQLLIETCKLGETAFQCGSREALLALCDMLAYTDPFGAPSTTVNARLPDSMLLAGAKLGHPKAQWLWGKELYNRRSDPASQTEGLRLLRQAAQSGDPELQYRVAMHLLNHDADSGELLRFPRAVPVTEENTADALLWLEQAAAQGHANAHRERGRMALAIGDYAAACRWLEKSPFAPDAVLLKKARRALRSQRWAAFWGRFAKK